MRSLRSSIPTRLEPHVAVLWSGVWNFTGVLVSSGAVAFSIVSLLPGRADPPGWVGRRVRHGLRLLLAAILWNLGTWYFGLPSSSSHTLIGSIIGVGIASQFMSPKSATSGVDAGRRHATSARRCSLSPRHRVRLRRRAAPAPEVRHPEQEPLSGSRGDQAAAVLDPRLADAHVHGRELRSVDRTTGRRGWASSCSSPGGHGPTAYALNSAVSPSDVQDFIAVSAEASATLDHYAAAGVSVDNARSDVTAYVRTRTLEPSTVPATPPEIVRDIAGDLGRYGELQRVPSDQVRNFRNDLSTWSARRFD